ncbi:MAG: cytochrome c oxidase subunit 2A [Chitinophagales bacterium]
MKKEHQSIEEFEKEKFVPKGAIAFFVLMIISFLVMWFSVYLLILSRIY